MCGYLGMGSECKRNINRVEETLWILMNIFISLIVELVPGCIYIKTYIVRFKYVFIVCQLCFTKVV